MKPNQWWRVPCTACGKGTLFYTRQKPVEHGLAYASACVSSDLTPAVVKGKPVCRNCGAVGWIDCNLPKPSECKPLSRGVCAKLDAIRDEEDV